MRSLCTKAGFLIRGVSGFGGTTWTETSHGGWDAMPSC